MSNKQASTIDFSAKGAWKRPFKNAKKLLWGEVGTTLLGFGVMALTTRTLGLADFGTLAVLTTTIGLLMQLITFESWQMVLRYGAQAFEEKNAHAYRSTVGFALGLEVFAACVGAVLIAALSPQIVTLFNIPESVAYIIPWTGLVLILSALGNISNGTLRLTDRFNVISAIKVAPKFLNFGIVVYLYLTEATLVAFIYKWFFMALITSALQFGVALYFYKKDILKLNKEAQNLAVTPWVKGRFFSPKHEAWRFAFGLYANSALGVGTQPLGGPVLAALLGPEAAGLYRIAEKISMAVATPVRKLLQPAVFTDMAWLNAKNNTALMKKMVLKMGGLMGSASILAFIVLVFAGKPIITLVAGEAFTPAYGAMLVLTMTTVVWSFTFTLAPVILTSGHVRIILIGRILKAGTLIALMVPLIQVYGVIGAAWAMLISSIVATTVPVYGVIKIISRQAK